MKSLTESCKMSRYRSILFLIIIFAFVGLFLLSRTGTSRSKEKNIFEIDLYADDDDADMTDEDKRHRNIIREGKFNIPELGLNFIENMEHNKKQTTTTPKPVFEPEITVIKNPPIYVTKDMSDSLVEENFFKYLEKKDVKCARDERVGFQHDGGWNVCFSQPFGFYEPCIIYSFGIGNDWRFDKAATKIYNCTVYAYDPSIPVPNEKINPRIHFKQLGIGGKNGKTNKGWRVKTFSSILKDNGHLNTVIEYLKFDIEYMEWRVLENLLKERPFKNVKQIGFEIHTNEFFQQLKKAGNVRFNSAKDDYLYMFQTIRKLEDHNFRKFNYRLNPFGDFKSPITRKHRSCCYELHFLNMNFVSSKYIT